MLPHQRAMVQRLQGQPFTLLGINSDQDRSVLQKTIRDEKITWPNISDGRDCSIARAWNVHRWPTIYVIDADGMVRYRDLHGEELEQAVTTLLATKHAVAAASTPNN